MWWLLNAAMAVVFGFIVGRSIAGIDNVLKSEMSEMQQHFMPIAIMTDCCSLTCMIMHGITEDVLVFSLPMIVVGYWFNK